MFAVLLVLAFFGEKRFKREWQKFLEDYGNKNILVCTRRHGWENFLINNFIPLLTDKTLVIWSHDPATKKLYRLVGRPTYWGWGTTSTPFVLVIRNHEVTRSGSLNRLLLAFKRSGKRDDKIQETARKTLQEQWPEIALNWIDGYCSIILFTLLERKSESAWFFSQ